MTADFRLRFPLSEVMYWAARYAYADDAEVEAIGDGLAFSGQSRFRRSESPCTS